MLYRLFKMGKKIKSVKAVDKIIHNSKKDCSNMLFNHISKNDLRKYIHSKLIKTRTSHHFKKTQFISRIKNGSFNDIIDKTQLECPICLELFVSPVLRKCGHIYCYRCMETQIAYNNSCCVCRQQQDEIQLLPSKMTEILISDFVLPKEIELYKYLCRSTDSQEWAKRRKIVNLQVGMRVDFKDFSNVWRRGVVINTFVAHNKDRIAQIKIWIKGQVFVEPVNIFSNRLAYSNFFTAKEYLQDFSPVLPELDHSQTSQKQIQFQEDNPNEEEEFFRSQIDHFQNELGSPEQINIQDVGSIGNQQNSVLSALNVLSSQDHYSII